MMGQNGTPSLAFRTYMKDVSGASGIWGCKGCWDPGNDAVWCWPGPQNGAMLQLQSFRAVWSPELALSLEQCPHAVSRKLPLLVSRSSRMKGFSYG